MSSSTGGPPIQRDWQQPADPAGDDVPGRDGYEGEPMFGAIRTDAIAPGQHSYGRHLDPSDVTADAGTDPSGAFSGAPFSGADDQAPYQQEPGQHTNAEYDSDPSFLQPPSQPPTLQPPPPHQPPPSQPAEQHQPYYQPQYQPAEPQPYVQPPVQQPPVQQPPVQQTPSERRPTFPPPPYQQQPGGHAAAGFAGPQPPDAIAVQPPSSTSAEQTSSVPGAAGLNTVPPTNVPAPGISTPRPEALLAPTRSTLDSTPAQSGWQSTVRRWSGGLVKPTPSAAELSARRAQIDIRTTFSKPMTVVVVQPKGGAGKTPTTIGLASALGVHRGGYVVGWDNNETRGTLAVRVGNAGGQRSTIWDLLRDLPSFERTDARVGDLSHYVRGQGNAQFDALVSDDSPGNMAQIGEDEFRRIHAVLQRFYRQIVIDTGNNVRSPNWQAAVNAADLIVVVSTYQRDVGYSASWVLDHLAETGRGHLVRSAVTVMTAADPRPDPTLRSELLSHFQARTRDVVEIPYDPLIALGGPMEWADLRPATQQAWTRAGAAVVTALAEGDERARQTNRQPY